MHIWNPTFTGQKSFSAVSTFTGSITLRPRYTYHEATDSVLYNQLRSVHILASFKV